MTGPDDFFPFPPTRDDPRISKLEAENEALRIENQALNARDREQCLEIARLQECCQRRFAVSSPDSKLSGLDSCDGDRER
jgi:hypothetical protein